MYYALCPWQGRGTRDEPFSPAGAQGGYSVLDLRPNPLLPEGYGLVASEEPFAAGVVHLADNPSGRIRPADLAAVGQALGVDLDPSANTVEALAVHLLLGHSGRGRGGWNGLAADARGQLRVHLGEVAFSMPRVMDLSISESFNVADQTLGTAGTYTLAGGFTWRFLKNGSNTFTIQSNQLSGTGADMSYLRAEVDLSPDHYSQIALIQGGTADRQSGPAVRMNTATDGGSSSTDYAYGLEGSVGADRWRLYKDIGGTETNLIAYTARTIASGDVFRLEANGSTLTAKINDATVGTVTDTSLGTGYVRAGILARNLATYGLMDNWEAGDLGPPQLFLGGSIKPAGVLAPKRMTRTLSGSTTPAGTFTKLRVVTRTFTGSSRPVGTTAKLLSRRLTGSSRPVGVAVKVARRWRQGSIAPAGALVRGFTKSFAGSVTPAGSVVTTFLGRIFGRPGIIALTHRADGEIRLRVRRGY